jgi:putative transcriptional regulator
MTSIIRKVALLTLWCAALIFVAAPVRAADESAPLILVATPVLAAGDYRETVLLAVPVGNGGHFGFILNRPTNVALGALFPGNDALRGIRSNVYLGGPLMSDTVFAVFRSRSDKDTESRNEDLLVKVAPRLYVALDSDSVDRVIADQGREARFFVGLVGWRVGELDAELRAGAWDVLTPDSDIVLSGDPGHLWTRLVSRARGVGFAHVVPSNPASTGLRVERLAYLTVSDVR